MKASETLERQKRILYEARIQKESLIAQIVKTDLVIDQQETLIALIKENSCDECHGNGTTLDIINDCTNYHKECNGTGFTSKNLTD